MKNNRYKWLLHQTTWWMPGLPAPHPFLFPPHPLSLSFLSPPFVFTSSVSLFGSGRLSMFQPPDVVRLRHLSSLLGTDTVFILTSYWARFIFHSFILFSLIPPPAVVPTGTLFSIPRSFLYTATAKQTPGTLWSKQPASCAVAPSVDSLSREQSVPLLLLCAVLFSPPGICIALDGFRQTGAMCWNNGWAAFSNRSVKFTSASLGST